MLHHRREVFRVQLVDVHVGDEQAAVGALGETIRLSINTQTRNISSRIDMHTHAGSTLRNHITLTFDLLTLQSNSVPAEGLA